jgi:hypothetical protein
MPHLPDADLSALCELLDTELERQHDILATVKAQGLAARAQNLEELDKRTAALSLLMHESLRSEQERLRLLRPIVEQFGLKGADQTLSNLVAAVPDPWKTRLAEFQQALKRTVAASRQEIHRNATVMRTTLKRVDNAMESVFQDGNNRVYSAGGSDVRRERAATMLDAMG